MIRIAVPGPDKIQVSYAGNPAVTYEVVDGVVEVSERHVAEFLAAIPGSVVAPPPSAEPAPEKDKSAKSAQEK